MLSKNSWELGEVNVGYVFINEVREIFDMNINKN